MGEQAAGKLQENGTGLFTRTRSYSADIASRQFAFLVAAIALGTMLEWYDFFAYSQLNAYLTRVFFLAGDPALSQLSFLCVYAVGFVSRPLGALVFGHLGDTRGRRICFLTSVSVMAVCTVLISCQPTFAQAGLAAPILLALLRAVQRLAMGGEFGCAMVYLYEMGPNRVKGLIGSIGVASAMVGCMMGVLAVVIMEAIFSPGQMLLFGWRLVFCLSIVSASLAFVLRLHMPEPEEFTDEREEIIFQNLQRIAARRPNSISVRRSSVSAANSTNGSNSARGRYLGLQVVFAGAFQKQKQKIKEQMQQEDLSLRSSSSTQNSENGDNCAAASDDVITQCNKDSVTAAASAAAAEPKVAAPSHSRDATVTITDADSIQEYKGEYVPALRLLRSRWGGVLLQFLLEAWVSIGFWVISTWLPVQLRKAPVNMPEKISQAMLIVNLTVMGMTQLAAGWASDKGMPRVWSCFTVFMVAAGISVPVFIGFARASAAGCWLLHLLLMVLMGWVLGVVPATCSSIYPATVRSSGFNLAYNMAMSWLGGGSPSVVSALATVTGSTMMAPGLLLVAAAVVSMAAALALLNYVPASNQALQTTWCGRGTHCHTR